MAHFARPSTLFILRISLRRSIVRPGYVCYRRNLATHRDTPASSLLSQTLDRAAHRVGSASSNPQVDTVGPFNLPIRPNSANQTKQKPWSELSRSGKVARGTARTTNLTVILLGGALTCVLAYALATELFARNSPTQLYEDACQIIAASPQVAQHLRPPLRFHTNAPSQYAPRHRARHVSSQLAVDESGKEHLLLHFFVESTHPDLARTARESPSISLSDLSVDSMSEWSKARAKSALELSKSTFAYLAGNPTQPKDRSPGQGDMSDGHPSQSTKRKPPPDASTGWGFAGLFAGIRGTSSSTKQEEPLKRMQYSEGEVHADLVKDETGDFKYRYLLVDFPHSRSQKPTRVYVLKGDNFRKGEGVFIWS